MAIRFLWNRHTLSCAILLIIQQMILASSALWLILLSRDIVNGQPFWTHLGLYLCSLVLPYLPQAGMSVAFIRWDQEAVRRYLDAFVANNVACLTQWSEKGKKEATLAVINHEGLVTISDSLFYYWNLISAATNVLLNIATISVLLNLQFFGSYAISLALGVALVRLQARKQARLAHRAQKNRVGLGKMVLAAWDNVLIGNPHNFLLWKDATAKRIRRTIRGNVASESFQQVIAVVIAFITFVPSLAVAARSMYFSQHDLATLSAFAITLPRIFQILTFTYELLFQVTRLGVMKTRLTNITNAITRPPEKTDTFQRRLSLSELEINSKSSLDLDSLLRATPLCDVTGRFTLRGRNGSGKSSLLLHIKQVLRGQAFYLPNNHDLIFRKPTGACSTGERMREHFSELLSKVRVPVLLLDEWDANLDATNVRLLSRLIDDLASTACVIEVRHRQDPQDAEIGSGSTR